MPKVFTTIPVVDHISATPTVFNSNTSKYLSSFNGALDGSNNPIETFREENFLLPEDSDIDTTPGADVLQLGTSYSTQAYYKTRRSSSFEGSGLDVWTPIATIDLDVDNWSKGFNTLTSLSGFEDFPLNINCIDGMLSGTATIDWEHGTQVFLVQVADDPPAFAPRSRGMEWWTEWGIFVNNILVARSGRIYTRRHTTSIPFSIAVGSQAVQIDCRFMTVTSRAIGDPTLDLVTSSEFNIFSAEIWVRNTIR